MLTSPQQIRDDQTRRCIEALPKSFDHRGKVYSAGKSDGYSHCRATLEALLSPDQGEEKPAIPHAHVEAEGMNSILGGDRSAQTVSTLPSDLGSAGAGETCSEGSTPSCGASPSACGAPDSVDEWANELGINLQPAIRALIDAFATWAHSKSLKHGAWLGEGKMGNGQ